MPVPAENFNVHRDVADNVVASSANGSVYLYGVDCSISSWWKVHPASISTRPPKPYYGKRNLAPRMWKPPQFIYGIREATPWSHVWTKAVASPSSVTLIAKTVPVNPFDPYIFAYPPSGFWYRQCYNSSIIPIPPSVIARSDRKMLESLQKQDLDVGVFFAELQEACETVTSTVTRIASEVTSFKRRYPKKWLQVLRHEDRARRKGRFRTRVNEIPSQYLAMQYGWNPLLQDVNHSLSLVNERLFGGEGGIVRVKGKAADTATDTLLFASNPPFTGSVLTVTRKWRVGCRTYAYYRLRNAGLAKLSQLGLINPAVVFWEKRPYSFVVDWFAPVGPWLNALTAAAGYDFVTGCRSTKAVVTGTSSSVELQGFIKSFYSVLGDPADVYSQYNAGRFDRQVLYSSPFPEFYFKNPVSTVHVANALALLRNAFRR